MTKESNGWKTNYTISSVNDKKKTEYNRLEELVQIYQREGKIDEAIMFRKNFAYKYPEVIPNIEKLTSLYQLKGDLRSAEYELKKNLEKNPDPIILIKLTQVLFQMEKNDEANKCLEYSEKHLENMNERIINENMDEETKESIMKHLSLAHFKLSCVYGMLENYKKVLEHSKAAKKLQEKVMPDNILPSHTLAQAYEQLELYEQAETELKVILSKEQVIENKPLEIVIHYQLGRIYLKQNKFDLAKEEMEKIEPYKDELFSAYYILKGDWNIKVDNNIDEAIKNFENQLTVSKKKEGEDFASYQKRARIIISDIEDMEPPSGNYSSALRRIGRACLMKHKEIIQEQSASNFHSTEGSALTPYQERALECYAELISREPNVMWAHQKMRNIIHEHITYHKDYLKTFDLVSELFRKNQITNNLSNIFASLFLSSKTKDYPKQLVSKVLSLILEDENLESHLEPFDNESFNKLSTNFSAPLTSEMFIIKTYKDKNEASIQNLKDEFLTSLFVWEKFKKDYLETNGIDLLKGDISFENVKTIEPVFFHEHSDGKHYLISRKENLDNLGANLLQMTDKEGKSELEEAMRALAKFHGLLTPLIKRDNDGNYYFEIKYNGKKEVVNVPKYDFKEELKSRLLKNKPYDKAPRLESLVDNINSDSVQEFLYLHERAVKGAEMGLPFFIHKDAHLLNFFRGGVIFDFERKSMGNPLLDVSLATIDLKPEFAENDILQEYIRETKKHPVFKEFLLTPEVIELDYKTCRVQNALCLLGTALSKNEKPRAMYLLNYLKMALNPFPGLKSSFFGMLDENTDKVNAYFKDFIPK